MNNSPHGKISRLPHHLREQVHARLRDAQPGQKIISWLNSLPEVQAALATGFAGRPISERNLSEWKKRSHRQWLLDQDALAQSGRFLAEARQLAEAGQGTVTDHFAAFLAARYALATRRLGDPAPGKDRAHDRAHWQLLRQLCHDVVNLRRGDHAAERLRLERVRGRVHPRAPMNTESTTSTLSHA